MPIQNSVPTKWSPKGLTDSADGTNSFQGAMRQLVNLIPDPSTAGVYVPRPAAEKKTDFTGTNAPSNAGILSGRLIIGDTEYGMVPSSLNPGKDEPYVLDLANDVFLPVSGITAANTPTSPPTSGDWVPPIMAQVASRVIVTHPGFPGGAIKFGWFDTGGFTETTLGNTHSNILIDGNPSILGVQPGMTVTGSGIPSNTSVEATAEFVLTTAGLVSFTTITGLDNSAGIAVGQEIFGIGIPEGTLVQSLSATVNATTGDTHIGTNILDNLDPFTLAHTPVFGEPISGTGIPAGTTVLAVIFNQVSTVGALNGTTTITTQTSAGLEVGQFVQGVGVVAGTRVNLVTPFSLDTSGDISAGSQQIINLASTTGVVPGQLITAFGVPTGASVVVSVDSSTQITMSLPAEQTLTGVAVNFSGATVLLDTAASITANFTLLVFASLTVTMSNDATASGTGTAISFTTVDVNMSQLSLLPPQRMTLTFSGATITLNQAATLTADNVSLTIAGGTSAAPQWGAGDTDRNPLLSTPLGVAQMNGRAFFADGLDGIPFSDSGFPCRRSNQPNVQALTTDDGLSVTAIGALVLGQPLTGGTVQALIAFEGETKMQQISGDPAFGNLAMNALQVATGTLAPLSIWPCGGQLGTAFISPQGLRFVRLDGSVTDPVGADGQGVVMPFQFAVAPSQICGAANAAVLRYSVQNGLVEHFPYQEYWFDLSRKTWSGPHTFPARLVQPWRSTFIEAAIGQPASLWQTDVFPTLDSSYEENGHQLSWIGETVLLPDNAHMSMNAIVESAITSAMPIADPIQITAFDENRRIIDIPYPPIAALFSTVTLRERNIEWTRPVIFKQMSVTMTGHSAAGVRLGNLYMRYEILGYNLDEGDDHFLLSEIVPNLILLDEVDDTRIFPG